MGLLLVELMELAQIERIIPLSSYTKLASS